MDGEKLQHSLRNRFKNAGIGTQDTWIRFAIERLTVRLVACDEDDRLLYKGGMLWWLQREFREHARPTTDLDVHVHAKDGHVLSPEEVTDLFRTAVTHAHVDDGCHFEIKKSHPLRHTEDHEGLRVHMRCRIGKAVVDFHVDVGFGGRRPSWATRVKFDSMHPELEGVAILAYPMEYMVADKVHSITKHGERNTRVKDYHDLAVLAGMNLDENRLAEAVRVVFEDHDVAVPESVEDLPGLSPEFARRMQDDWVEWTVRSRRDHAVPADFWAVVGRVRVIAQRALDAGQAYAPPVPRFAA